MMIQDPYIITKRQHYTRKSNQIVTKTSKSSLKTKIINQSRDKKPKTSSYDASVPNVTSKPSLKDKTRTQQHQTYQKSRAKDTWI